MEKEAAFKAGWNHQLLKCGGGEIAANHGKSWSSPWRRWMHVYMMDDRWGRADGGMRLWTSYWNFYILNFLDFVQLWLGIEMNMSQVWLRSYFPKQSSMQGAACKEANVTSRKAERRLKNLERSRRPKIWVSNQFDKGTVATKCRKMADSQIPYNLHITSMFSTNIVCLIHRFINWSSTGHNMSTCIFGKLHFALRKIFGPPFPPQTLKIP